MPFGAWLRGIFGGGSRSVHHGSKSTKGQQGNRKTKRNQVTPEQELKLRNLEKVLKELECPICFNTCIPPIFTCMNGHIVCSKCKKNVKQCPTCREVFSTTRNLFAEQFIEQYSQGCRYAKDGCKFLKWKGDDMKPHERECDYRMIKCVVPSCDLMVHYQGLLEHLIEAHKIGGTERIPIIVSFHMDPNQQEMRDRKFVPYYIKAYGCTFYLMFEILRPHFWIWVGVHCPKAELSHKFNFTATLKFDNRKNTTMEWTGPVYPIRTPGSIIIRDGPCFGGAESVLQHFQTESELPLFVNIERVHGGFMDGSLSDADDHYSNPSLNNLSQMAADGEPDVREENFSRMVIAASNQLIQSKSVTTTLSINDSGRGKHRKSKARA